MSKIDEVIKHVLEIDKRTQPKPWSLLTHINGTASILDANSETVCLDAAMSDANVIAEYRTSAPRLARALRVAVDGLNDISNAGHTAEYHSCGETVAAREILAAIQKEFE